MRDFLWRQLTAGDTADYIGRAVTAGADYLGRDLIATVAWALSTAFAKGDFLELSTGQLLRAVVGGTTKATGSEPIAPGYGNTVVDGTVTWEQVTG